jgi:hypothetical protein
VRYLFLLWGDESAELALSPEERQAIVAAHGAFLTGLQAEGRSVSGEPLGPSAGAVVVRPGGSGRSISDGPFLETKEQLGGFYLIDARDRHDAIELARRIPQSPGLTIEIRPIPD